MYYILYANVILYIISTYKCSFTHTHTQTHLFYVYIYLLIQLKSVKIVVV